MVPETFLKHICLDRRLDSMPKIKEYLLFARSINVVQLCRWSMLKVYGMTTAFLSAQVLKNFGNFKACFQGINQNLSEKLINDRNKDHQNARRVARLLEQYTRGLNRNLVSTPPRGAPTELKQVELWRKYIHWEKSNPLNLDDYSQLAKRGNF